MLIIASFLKWEHCAVLVISKFFIKGGLHVHSSPTPLRFMDEVLSEEIVKKDNEMGGNIPGGKFLGEDFFGGGDIPGGV